MPHGRVPDSTFTSIVAIAADAIISCDAEQRVLFFNEGAEKIFGWSASEVLGQPLSILLPERFRRGHGAHVEQFGHGHDRARRMGDRREISGLRRSGEEFPAEASISRVTTERGPVFTVVMRDITDRKRAADRMAFLAHAGERLAESLDVATVLTDVAEIPVPFLAEAAVVEIVANGALVAQSTHPVEAVRVALLGSRHGAPADLDDGHPATMAREHDRAFEVIVDPAEPPDWLPAVLVTALAGGHMLSVPLHAHGRPIGALTLSRTGAWTDEDRTLAVDLARRAGLALDNARLHEQVRQALRLRDDMTGIVSHDLRNPVQAVKMLAGAIAGSARDLPPIVAEHLAVIRQAADQMDTLIQDLLDAARLDSGRLHVTARPEAPATVINAALDPLAPLAAARGITLVRALDESLPPVLADAARVAQLLSNLVGNAIKFTPAGGTIRVAATVRAGELLVQVQDTGPGIPADMSDRVFERYVQVGRGERHGAGLGLPIARGIVEAHGGRIWHEPAPGGGSVFAFTLPLLRDVGD